MRRRRRAIDRIVVQLEAGRTLPGRTPRFALAVLSTAAYLVAPPVPASITVVLVVVGAVFPTPAIAWGGILVLGLAQLANPDQPGDLRLYAALALVHLLHVVAGLASTVDPRGTMQARVLIRPLRRWLLIQTPAQAVLAVVLMVHAGSRIPTASPLAPILGAVGAALVVFVVVRLARRG